MINPFPNDKILAWTLLKAFEEDKFNVAEMMISFFDMVEKLWEKEKMLVKPIPTQWHLLTPLGNKPFENTVGKGEIARNEQFLLFPQCFYL